MKLILECKNSDCLEFQKPKKLDPTNCFCVACGGKMLHCCKQCHTELSDEKRELCLECEEKQKNRPTAETMLDLLNALYDKCLNGIPPVSPSVEKMAQDYIGKHDDIKKACKSMLNNQIIKCTTSGFITGFGGLITLPVTIPANVSSVLYVQMRMIACAAYMNGYDLDSDQTQTLVYACLAGVSVDAVVKPVAIKFGLKATKSLIEKIPGKTLVKINQKVGFRFLTKFGEKGLINLGKMIPVAGAVISGGFDLAETKIIANRAYKWFYEGDFSDKAQSAPKNTAENDIIDPDPKDDTHE